jgi:RNA polymerase sigma-70 factor, ECF subfamily
MNSDNSSGMSKASFVKEEGGDTVLTKVATTFHKRVLGIPLLHSPAEIDDVTLVAAAGRGQDQAFEILVGRYQSRILAVALRFTHVREDAEDIVQQSFQKAFVHLRQFEGNSSFSTWLTRIAINEALMWLRKKRSTPEVAIEGTSKNDEPALPQDFPDSGPNPEESCIQREREQILSATMNELTPAMRTAIQLRELSGLSTEEAARAMGISVEAVKGRVFHARRKLRQILRRHAEFTRTRKNRIVQESCKANDILPGELAEMHVMS